MVFHQGWRDSQAEGRIKLRVLHCQMLKRPLVQVRKDLGGLSEVHLLDISMEELCFLAISIGSMLLFF